MLFPATTIDPVRGKRFGCAGFCRRVRLSAAIPIGDRRITTPGDLPEAIAALILVSADARL
jgi:hypothetical protein